MKQCHGRSNHTVCLIVHLSSFKTQSDCIEPEFFSFFLEDSQHIHRNVNEPEPHGGALQSITSFLSTKLSTMPLEYTFEIQH